MQLLCKMCFVLHRYRLVSTHVLLSRISAATVAQMMSKRRFFESKGHLGDGAGSLSPWVGPAEASERPANMFDGLTPERAEALRSRLAAIAASEDVPAARRGGDSKRPARKAPALAVHELGSASMGTMRGSDGGTESYRRNAARGRVLMRRLGGGRGATAQRGNGPSVSKAPLHRSGAPPTGDRRPPRRSNTSSDVATAGRSAFGAALVSEQALRPSATHAKDEGEARQATTVDASASGRPPLGRLHRLSSGLPVEALGVGRGSKVDPKSAAGQLARERHSLVASPGSAGYLGSLGRSLHSHALNGSSSLGFSQFHPSTSGTGPPKQAVIVPHRPTKTDFERMSGSSTDDDAPRSPGPAGSVRQILSVTGPQGANSRKTSSPRATRLEARLAAASSDSAAAAVMAAARGDMLGSKSLELGDGHVKRGRTRDRSERSSHAVGRRLPSVDTDRSHSASSHSSGDSDNGEPRMPTVVEGRAAPVALKQKTPKSAKLKASFTFENVDRDEPRAGARAPRSSDSASSNEDGTDGADGADGGRTDLSLAMEDVAIRAVERGVVVQVSASAASRAKLGAASASSSPRAAKRDAAAGAAAARQRHATERHRKQQEAEREAAEAQRKEELDRAKQRIHNIKTKNKQLSPLLLLKRKQGQAKALKKQKERAARRRAAAAATREREARERELMAHEEWETQRAVWYAHHRDGTWKTVRVFISSTFRDMHGERDALTRNVFPALNQRCRARKVRVVPVDLRWGLTAEDTSDDGLGALEHCLLEIEQARPFFIVLAGERYGWVPPAYRVSDKPEFQWVKSFEPGHSITAMEIYHGFLRKPFTPVHALLYERDPSFMDDVVDDDELDIFAFDYDDDEILDKRNKLRDEMRKHPFCKNRSYPCSYGGLDEEGKPVVTDLQEFEKQVLNDMWEAICFEFPPPPPPPSALALERMYHIHFLEDRSADFIGRKEMMQQMTDYCDEDASVSSLPLVVVGAPGSGKTSLVSAFATRWMATHTNTFTLAHVVGASPTSADIRDVLLRLIRELEERFMFKTQFDGDDFHNVREGFGRALETAGQLALEQDTKVMLIIDAVNQLLADLRQAQTMEWLPTVMPPGIRCLLSTTPGADCLAALVKRDPAPRELHVPGLSIEERKDIVTTRLAQYRKKLTSGQMDLVLAKQESDKPLYLLTCCEELRLQAQYGFSGAGVDEMIVSLPDNIPALLAVVLDRVERDLTVWMKSAGGQFEWVPQAIVDEPASARGTEASGSMRHASMLRTPTESLSSAMVSSKGTYVPPLKSPGASTSGSESMGGQLRRQMSFATSSVADVEHVEIAPGANLVRSTLSLLVCSRHGLRETDLLQLLAPPNKSQLPQAVWARLFRSLELYLKPGGGEEESGST